MSSPHTPTEPVGLPTAAVACVAVAAIGLTLLAGIIAASVATPYEPGNGVGAAISAVTAIAGCAAIVTAATDRVMRRLDALEAKLDEQRQEEIASAFVAGAAGRGQHLSVVPR